MINLLPPELKETYRYGRRNRVLLRWISTGALGLVGGAVLVLGGYVYLNHTIQDSNRQLTYSNKQLQQLDQATVQKQVTNISNNLKLATQVLSKEVLFSKLLRQLGTVTPRDVILTNLSITQIEGAVDLTAQTTNYNAATQFQVNLADSANKIFSQADIENINCNAGGTNAQYPCSVSLRALFAANSPFLFINDGAKGGTQ